MNRRHIKLSSHETVVGTTMTALAIILAHAHNLSIIEAVPEVQRQKFLSPVTLRLFLSSISLDLKYNQLHEAVVRF